MAKNNTTENINHLAGIRLRVLGSGELNIRISSLSDVIIKDLVPITMQDPARIEPYRIINFVSQKSKITLSTDDFDSVMRVNKIVVFLKPIFTQYPGN